MGNANADSERHFHVRTLRTYCGCNTLLRIAISYTPVAAHFRATIGYHVRVLKGMLKFLHLSRDHDIKPGGGGNNEGCVLEFYTIFGAESYVGSGLISDP
jgi:hypothetical protein